MARALLIGAEQAAAVKAALARARAKPLPWKALREMALPPGKRDVSLADRNETETRRPQSESVLLPVGFRCAVSFEEQPAGLCKHLSVSVDAPGALPGVEAAFAIAELFGFRPPRENWRMWLEEFDPGQRAVNFLELVEPRKGPEAMQ